MKAIFQNLDLKGDGPLYLRLKMAIAEAISNGALNHGAALPPEREFAEMSGLSRVTVRRAIEELTREGLIMRRQGAGTFVARSRQRIQQPLNRLTSFSDDMKKRGLTPGSRWLARGLFEPSSYEVTTLGLSQGVRVARLKRIRVADSVAVAIESSSLPEDILVDPETVQASLYEALSQRGVDLTRAQERISACRLNEAQSLFLGVDAGAPALSVQRLAYDKEGRLIEVTQTYYRADVYDMVAELVL